MKNYQQIEKSRGFTLMETVVVIAIFTIIMTVISSLIVNFYRTNDYAIQQSQAIGNGRQAVNKLVTDLRETTLSDDGNYPLRALGEYSIEFYSDVDLDNSVELIKYSTNNADQLVKEIYENDGGSYILASTNYVANYVRNTSYERDGVVGVNIFTYFDTDGAEVIDLSDLDEVRYIKVELIVNVNPDRQPEEFVLLSSSHLRNLPVIE